MDYNNVATFHLAPRYSKYHAFCAEAEIDDNYVLHCEKTNITSDNENEEREVQARSTTPNITTKVSEGDTGATKEG